jgi:uncharacterized protein (DUF1330 family)
MRRKSGPLDQQKSNGHCHAFRASDRQIENGFHLLPATKGRFQHLSNGGLFNRQPWSTRSLHCGSNGSNSAQTDTTKRRELMASYVVGVVNKRDLEKYGLYAEAGYQSIDGFDVEVTIAEHPETLEGKFPGSTMIIMKFKEEEGATRWYNSDAYQAAKLLRHAAADTPFMIQFHANEGHS